MAKALTFAELVAFEKRVRAAQIEAEVLLGTPVRDLPATVEEASLAAVSIAAGKDERETALKLYRSKLGEPEPEPES